MDATNDTYTAKVIEYVETGIVEVDTQVRRGYYAVKRMADIVFRLLGLLFLCLVLSDVLMINNA